MPIVDGLRFRERSRNSISNINRTKPATDPTTAPAIFGLDSVEPSESPAWSPAAGVVVDVGLPVSVAEVPPAPPPPKITSDEVGAEV